MLAIVNQLFKNISEDHSYIINTDGGARGNPGPAAIGIVFYDSKSKKIGEYASYIGDKETNNTAEYTAILEGLKILIEADENIVNVLIRSDSEVVVNQINGKYKVKEIHLNNLYQAVNSFLKLIPSWKIIHIKREQNKEADKLVNMAIDMKIVETTK